MAPYRILIINPNTSQSMTDALKPLVDSLGYENTEYRYFTAPSGPSSINNMEDCQTSTDHCLPALLPLLKNYDAFLVACYSPHPLTSRLRALCVGRDGHGGHDDGRQNQHQHQHQPVIGILEASVTAALQMLDAQANEVFGVVSTGKVWEEILEEGILDFLGRDVKRRGTTPSNTVFVGVETTGLSAGELHEAPEAEVKTRVKTAAKALYERAGKEGKTLRAVLLGCAGMAGMDGWVREVVDPDVRVVDGVMAGVAALQGLLRCRF